MAAVGRMAFPDRGGANTGMMVQVKEGVAWTIETSGGMEWREQTQETCRQ